MDDRYLPVYEVLKLKGLDVLLDSKLFIACLIDMNPSEFNQKRRMIEFSFNDITLKHLHSAAKSGQSQLIEAENKAVMQVCNELGIENSRAAELFSDLCNGIRLYLNYELHTSDNSTIDISDDNSSNEMEESFSTEEDFEIYGSVDRELIKYNGNATHVTIPEGVTIINERAFEYSEEMRSVIIPDSVKKIEDSAFYGCTNLFSIHFNKVFLHAYVEELGSFCFAHCDSLVNIDIPDSIERIGDYCFDSCSNLEYVTIPGSIKSISEYAFRDCTKLTTIFTNDGTERIEKGAFEGCRSLYDPDLPYTLKNIGDGAFKNCNELDSIYLPKSIYFISEDAFEGCAVDSECGLTIRSAKGTVGEKYARDNGYNYENETSICEPLLYNE